MCSISIATTNTADLIIEKIYPEHVTGCNAVKIFT